MPILCVYVLYCTTEGNGESMKRGASAKQRGKEAPIGENESIATGRPRLGNDYRRKQFFQFFS